MSEEKEITYTTEKRDIGTLVEHIEKQYYTVGKHLQNFLADKKEAEGKELKTLREYMESQRAYVWETWRASNLVQTVLLKNPIPEITVYRADDKSQFRKTVDGQQRLTSIYLFINNGFKLDVSKTMFPKFTIEGEQFGANETLQGKTFSELPELWQDIIRGYQLRITTMNNCTEEDAEKAFVQMNSGAKGLKPSEIRKAAMGSDTRKFFRSILDSDWILHALTPLATKGNAGDEILSQVITLIHNNGPIELSKDNIDKAIYGFREFGLPEELEDDMINVSNYLSQATEIWIDNKKKEDAKEGSKRVKNYATYRYTWLNKTTTVMLMYSAHSALRNNVTVEEFSAWAYNFFQFPTKEYKEGLQDKAIDLKRVEMRLNAIQTELNKLSSFEQVVENEQEEIVEEQEEQPLQTENSEPAITDVLEELDDEAENQEEQTEESNADQEDVKAILNIIDNVA